MIRLRSNRRFLTLPEPAPYSSPFVRLSIDCPTSPILLCALPLPYCYVLPFWFPSCFFRENFFVLKAIETVVLLILCPYRSSIKWFQDCATDLSAETESLESAIGLDSQVAAAHAVAGANPSHLRQWFSSRHNSCGHWCRPRRRRGAGRCLM